MLRIMSATTTGHLPGADYALAYLRFLAGERRTAPRPGYWDVDSLTATDLRREVDRLVARARRPHRERSSDGATPRPWPARNAATGAGAANE